MARGSDADASGPPPPRLLLPQRSAPVSFGSVRRTASVPQTEEVLVGSALSGLSGIESLPGRGCGSSLVAGRSAGLSGALMAIESPKLRRQTVESLFSMMMAYTVAQNVTAGESGGVEGRGWLRLPDIRLHDVCLRTKSTHALATGRSRKMHWRSHNSPAALTSVLVASMPPRYAIHLRSLAQPSVDCHTLLLCRSQLLLHLTTPWLLTQRPLDPSAGCKPPGHVDDADAEEPLSSISIDDDEGSSGVGLAAAAAAAAAMARAWAQAASKEQRDMNGGTSSSGAAKDAGKAGFRLVATVTNKMGELVVGRGVELWAGGMHALCAFAPEQTSRPRM